MRTPLRHIALLSAILLTSSSARGQTLRVSFDAGLKAEKAAGRAEPWVSESVELVPGKFGKAAHIGGRGQLIYAGEQNLLAARGTIACWCRIPERPGPLDVQRILFVQSKERGYWTYLAALEWQEGAFRAMVFDFYHGHGPHDATALPAFRAGQWHHVALAWDQAHGVKFFLDGKPAGSTWGQQAWWERPTPHAIHLSYPGADYDELCVYPQALTDQEIAQLAQSNQTQVPDRAESWDEAARTRLVSSLGVVGLEHLPTIDAARQASKPQAVIRQARVLKILDDRIPSWKVMDGRMNLFWPEWRAPVLGDVDFSGSELHVEFAPEQALSHLLLRGLVGGCQVFGERDGHVSRATTTSVPTGLHFLAADKLPPRITGLRIPRREGMKLQEIVPLAVTAATDSGVTRIRTPLTGTLALDSLGPLAADIRTRTLPSERLVLGQAIDAPAKRHHVAPLTRLHLLTEPAAEVVPLDAVEVRLAFSAAWKEDIWWLRVQDPVNPRRDLMHIPLRIRNPAPGEEVVVDIVLDFWDIMLDSGNRLWVEVMPTQEVHIATGEKSGSALSLVPGDRARVLKEFGHTQSQLAFGYWQLGSEVSGGGADPKRPGFALLGNITHNLELKLTLEWVRRHIPDQPLVNNLWRVIYEASTRAPVKPRLQPAGAPEWALWGRELLERFRSMSHHWADVQGPDGQVGGGWNDDTDFPGVFLCLPLLGDQKTQQMFTRIFDGIDKTGYLDQGIARGPIDALHATDFLSWRAHLMLFDYGEPRHVERALDLTRALQRWTRVDAKGHRHFLANIYSEDGPEHQPASEIGSAGLVSATGGKEDSTTSRNFLRDPIFCAWYSRNPTVLKFVREVAETDYARAAAGAKLGAYEFYPFFSYYRLFGDNKFLNEPKVVLHDRWNLPIWRRYVENLPNGKQIDDQLLKAARVKTASEEHLTTGYLISRDRKFLVDAMREACERLEGGWQFRGGAALGANDHFYVPGQAALSQMYLGSALTWLRPASILPPIAVSWEGLDAEVAAIVLEASPLKLRLAAYNFTDRPRKVRMRVWELAAGKYQLKEGLDANQDDQIDGSPATRDLSLQRSSTIELELPAQKVHIVELHQVQAQPRPELLADLAIGEGDIFYDKASDRLKVVVHNLGAAAAENVTVRFETPDGRLLGERTIARLEAPIDLKPKTVTVWLPQPTLHPVDRIVVRIDPAGRVDEITRANNVGAWVR